MRANSEKMGSILSRLLPRLATERNCTCAQALDDAAV
jgi:hypothetical protein